MLFEGRGVAANVEVTGEARNEAPVSWSTRSRHSWLVPVSMSRETSLLRTKRNSQGPLERTFGRVVPTAGYFNTKTTLFTATLFALGKHKGHDHQSLPR